MRKSKIRQKLDAGQVARVCALGSNVPYYPQMAAHFGYDGVWVDGEHRVWDPREITELVARHHLADIDCLFRPATTEKSGISRLLEDGVAALMIPQVNDTARARHLMEAAKFPPVGDRGLDGSGVDAGFWIQKGDDYIKQRNHETVLILQIETPQALEAMADIIAIPGVDALFLGPGDLSLRLGCTGSIRDPQILDAATRLAAVCKAAGKAWGMPVGNIEDAKTVVDLGCQILAMGNEFWGIHDHLKSNGEQLQSLLG
ncbi:aldolase/citrate lyase family protein [Prosthecobacter sp. SYSU 5D2]|uniref:HpcH/HpaI aldolase family protein n=1 Tax=Prosthecobacter sp. SYSU 5D2 TaxID=3134134 RepID=UPI0031FF3C3D